MALIKLRSPWWKKRDLPHGMDVRQQDIEHGAPPPVVYPHCRKCGVPPERFMIDPQDMVDKWFVPITVQCHGKTTGRRVPRSEVLESALKGKPIWFFTGARG